MSGNATPGYEDLILDKDLKPPKNETLNRDKILAMYRASNLDQRIDTDVWVWVQGDYVPMNLIGAAKYLSTFHVSGAGRRLEDQAAHGELPPDIRPSLKLDTVEAAANAKK